MFSWSTSNGRQSYTRTPPPATAAAAPGSSFTQAATPAVVSAVPGTVRPPVASYTRAQHIESFLNDPVLQRSTRRISQDDTIFDTVFQTTQGHALILRVHVPPALVGMGGPSVQCRAPTMTLVGVRTEHEWLDGRNRVIGYPPIRSDETWSNSRILLGQAVHQVVQHLQLQPPRVLEITDPGLRQLQASLGNKGASSAASASASSSASSSLNSANHATSAKGAPPSYDSFVGKGGGAVVKESLDIEMPAIPTQFDELDKLDRDGLEKLLDDEIEFSAFINKLPVVKEVRAIESSVMDENFKMAKDNLALEPNLKELRSQVADLQVQLRVKLATFRALEQEQDQLAAPPDVKLLLRQLNQGKREALDQSERLAEEWVESGGDDFVDKFLELRSLHHLRAAKLERLQQQQLQQQQLQPPGPPRTFRP